MSENIFSLKKAIDRLVWRFTNGNFTPNQNDLDALKFIADWIKREKEIEVNKNRIFAKIYAYALFNELEFYKDIEFASKKLQEVLSNTAQLHYDKVHETLNRLELEQFLRKIGISQLHPIARTEVEDKNDKEIINNNLSDFNRFVKGIWSKEDVYEKMNFEISEVINKYKNYEP